MTISTKTHESETTTLKRLNQEYVDAFMKADVGWYRLHLAEDFVVIESDGSVLTKAKFLLSTARGPDVTEYKLQEVDVRVYGIAAVVRATGFWKGHDGTDGMSRYTDIYVKNEQGWKVVSAQITRGALSYCRK